MRNKYHDILTDMGRNQPEILMALASMPPETMLIYQNVHMPTKEVACCIALAETGKYGGYDGGPTGTGISGVSLDGRA